MAVIYIIIKILTFKFFFLFLNVFYYSHFFSLLNTCMKERGVNSVSINAIKQTHIQMYEFSQEIVKTEENEKLIINSLKIKPFERI